MTKISISKGILKDIIIVGVGVLVIWIGLQVAFGTQNPFYVVASGSMIPVLQVHDVIIVQGYETFEEIEVGDIIVFDRPSDHNRVIVHRVDSIMSEDPKTIKTKGDANPGSIPGTDFPITEEEYIGKVAYTIPQVGYVTQLLKPPVNYVIIAIVIGVMIVKQITKKKKDNDESILEQVDSEDQEVNEELAEIDEMEKDSEYSQHADKSETTEREKIENDESVKEDKKKSKNEDKKY